MDAEAKQSFIREKALQNERDSEGTKVVWSRHAVTELVADDLTRHQVERALQECELISVILWCKSVSHRMARL